jgi:small-conductance mechanosensitive channel
VEFEIGDLTVPGMLTATVFVVLGAFVALHLVSRTIDRADLEATQRYNARRLARTIVVLGVIIALVLVWRPLGGSLGPALGLATAGLAFAMQEVIGAIAGWFNITFGSIFTVGDRVQVGEVRGDVIDISLLKSRIMEIGSTTGGSGVRGAQYTGRVVTVSNKATFTAPVYNYSAYFDFIWDELEVAVPHHEDWERAIAVMEEEARRPSSSEGARAAMDDIRRRFPVAAAEVQPLVFAEADETYIRLYARFVVPIRSVRSVRDEITRRVHRRLEEEGIEVVATSVIQSAASKWHPVGADSRESASG